MRNRIPSFFSSLKLTVGCLAAAMLLVFAGTWAQMEVGIWEAQRRYFSGLLVWGELPGAGWKVPVFPGGYVVGGVLLLNLLAAHAMRFRWTWNKSGIFLTHAGVLVLIAGGFLTDFLAVEGQLRFREGESSNYWEHAREVELAVVEVAGAGRDRVTAIPERFLRAGAELAPEGLPFRLRVRRFLPNADLGLAAQSPGDVLPEVDRGWGAKLAVRGRTVTYKPEEQNLRVAVVELVEGQRPLGTWLLSNALDAPQWVEAGGREFHLALRRTRTYLPFALRLNDFSHDRYPGTEVPRNFSSDVRLSDPAGGGERNVVISMNRPLRHAGWTFYQQSFAENDTVSILQVVRNPGWLVPYVSCVLVSLGLLVQFGIHLAGYLGRRVAPRESTLVDAGERGNPDARVRDTARGGRYAPAVMGVAGLLAAGYLLSGLRPPGRAPNGMPVAEVARIPVQSEGRVKPLDSAARHALLLLRERQSLRLPEGGELPAAAWLAELLLDGETADTRPVFAIHHPDLVNLAVKGGEGQRAFSFAILRPQVAEIMRQGEGAGRVEAQQRDPFQREVVELARNVDLYMGLRCSLAPPGVGDPGTFLAEYRGQLGAGAAAFQAHQGAGEFDRAAFDRFLQFAAVLREADGRAALRLVPPADHEGEELPDWMTWGAALVGGALRQDIDGVAAGYAVLPGLWRGGDAGGFSAAARDLRGQIEERAPHWTRKAQVEFWFNQADVFYRAMGVYVLAFVLACVSWMKWPRTALGAATALATAALVAHTAGLVLRMYIQGRPPVTNLYSSAIFVGWGGAVLGLVLERMHRNGIGTACAAATGFLTLIIAHHLAEQGDTMALMQAVLDTNFWLATHVVVVTLGYAATFLAGFLALLFIVRGFFTPSLDAGSAAALERMVYGVVCFGLLFSFVGTVLGGIWADQSWGRFWGWDPKENGALLIVLWNALILHARWGGMIRRQGLMVLAVCGNIVTAWSWFGTNMLGVGLHSYGFMDKAFFWLALFIFVQLLVMAVGSLPLVWWGSFEKKQEAAGERK